MSLKECPHEKDIARAVRIGAWPPALLAHAAECGACRDALRAAQEMAALATAPGVQQPSPLPDASLVWQRARLQLDRRSGRNLRGALEWAQIILAAGVPLTLACWVALNWFGIEAGAAQVLLSVSPLLAGYGLAALAPALLTIAALALGYPILAGD